MKILIVTKMWTAVKPFFLEAVDDFYGLPSFTVPFSKILGDPSFEEIHVLLFIPTSHGEQKRNVNIPKKYADKLKVYPVYYSRYRELLLKSFPVILNGVHIVKKNKIEAIFGHGVVGAFAGLISLLTGVKNIRRIYGVGSELTKKSKLQILFRHPLEFLLFTLPAEALIVTDDGSRGDEVFRKLNGTRSAVKSFYFMKNGVWKNTENLIKEPGTKILLPKNYISYIARFEPFKRQLEMINVIAVLKDLCPEVKVVMVGQVSDRKYFEVVYERIKKLDLEGNVLIIPGLPWSETMYVLKNSRISCIFYNFTLSNVLLESLVLGVPVIALNSGGALEDVPDDVLIKLPENAIESPKFVAEEILRLWHNDSERERLAKSSKEYATMYLTDWSDRAEFELSLIRSIRNTSDERCGNGGRKSESSNSS